MAFAIGDALQLLEELKSLIGSMDETSGVTCAAQEKIELAKAMWAAHQQEDAFTLTMEALEVAAHKPVQSVSRLQQLETLVQKAAGHVEDPDNRLRALEHTVAELNKGVKQLEADKEQAVFAKQKGEQLALLGQVAYTMSHIAEKHVYGKAGSSSFVPLSLFDIEKNVSKMSPEQHQRWKALKHIISREMSVPDAQRADGYLRWLRNAPAHVTSQQARQTSSGDLKRWAKLRCDEKAVNSVHKYVDVLSRLGQDGRPLSANDAQIACILAAV